MLFRKQIDPRCAYCERGRQLDEAHVACPIRGMVAPGEHCSRFVYDPLKRIPPSVPVADLDRWKPEDFQWEDT